jgi:Flp pilus assembly pilin Flp
VWDAKAEARRQKPNLGLPGVVADESGQALVEYEVLIAVALIAFAAIASMATVAMKIYALFSLFGDRLEGYTS